MAHKSNSKRLFGTLILAIFILSGMFGVANITAETNDANQNYNDIAYKLFKRDPTNPTQILKNKFLADETLKQDSIPKLSVPVHHDVIDDVRDFWIIDSFLVFPYSYVQRSARLLAIGDHCYVYVLSSVISSEGLSNAETKAELWRNEFELKIYPNDLTYFGNPNGNLGDIDGDSHVTILIASLDAGVAGYFDPNNEFPGSTSNTREMVYVDYYTTYGVLAHEFQHLIHFNYDQDEFWWIDEGCAEYAKFLNGYDVSNNLTSFASSYFATNPDESLLYWNYESEGGKDVRIDYGSAYMFIFYLAEKYGVAAVTNLVNSVLIGAPSVESALLSAGYSISFNELYLNWATALYVDDTSFGGGLYGFENLNILMDYELMSTFPATKSNKLNRFYGLYVTKLSSPPDYLMLETTAPATFSLGISIAVHDTFGWHVKQNVQSGDITDFINGSVIDEAYVISSVMSASTPVITTESQFGVGTPYYLDYIYTIGNPLYLDSSPTFTYEGSAWEFTLENVVIVDENATEITNTSGVSVYALFRIGGTTITYETLLLNYSVALDWYIDTSLQAFDEKEYDVSIVASGSSQYGIFAVDTISVFHTLLIEKPVVSINLDNTVIQVTINASYTQLGGWEAFTQNALTTIVLYDKNGYTQDSFDISYDSLTNGWEADNVDLSLFYGEHYIQVIFGYAARTVRSVSSDLFMVEGEPPTSTNFLGLSHWTTIMLAISGISVLLFLRRRKR